MGIPRRGGKMPDGGGAFENILVAVNVTAGDRLQRCELFDVGDTDQALARFEELCAHLG